MELLIRSILQLCGMVAWLHLMLLLMQIVICKDARYLDIKKFKKVGRKVRWRSFRRHYNNDKKYAAFVWIFVGGFIACNVMMYEMYGYKYPAKNIFWLTFHPIIVVGIHKYLNADGYTIKLVDVAFNKWKVRTWAYRLYTKIFKHEK